jgi:phage shock protein A
MSIFNRIANLISGFFNSLLGGIEKSNPALVYEQAINNKISQHKKLREAVANLTMLRNKTNSSLEDETKRLEEIQLYLETCLNEGDDENSLMLLEQKNELEQRIQELQSESKLLNEQCEEAIESLTDHRNDIDKLKREKAFKLAQHKAAQLKNETFEQINGISEDADAKAIENIRDQIDNEIAKSNLNTELVSNSSSFKMKKFKNNSSKLRARKQLEELKAQQVKILNIQKNL